MMHQVAKLIRVEGKDGNMYLIFEVTDKLFQEKVKEDWLREEELILIKLKDLK